MQAESCGSSVSPVFSLYRLLSDRRLSSLVLGGGAAVGAEVETVGGAGDCQVPVWLGPGVPPPRPRLRGAAAAGHRLWKLGHGWQAGQGSRGEGPDQRGFPHLFPAGEVSIRIGTQRIQNVL